MDRLNELKEWCEKAKRKGRQHIRKSRQGKRGDESKSGRKERGMKGSGVDENERLS